MTLEERIDKLEEDIAQLTVQNSELVALLQTLGGHQRMYHAAIESIIIAHPCPQALRPVLETLLAKVDAAIVARAESDDHLEAAQASQECLMAALDEAEVLYEIEEDDAPTSG
jgi:D-serine deaminase-like pyridoxal phosphate-dependent protein